MHSTCRPAPRRRLAAAVLIVLAGLILGSCGSAKGVSPSSKGGDNGTDSGTTHPAFGLADSPGSQSATVTYTDRAVVVDRGTVAHALTSVSPDGTTYTFSSTDGKIGQLKEGSVMLLQGTALRTVTSVSSQGSGVVVKTGPAALTDLISDGSINWDSPVDFTSGFLATTDEPNDDTAQAQTPVAGPDDSASPTDTPADTPTDTPSGASGYVPGRLQPAAARRAPSVASGKPIKLKGDLPNDYSFELELTPSAKELGFDVTLSKDAKLNISAELKGTVTGFTSSGDIQVHGGQVSTMKLLTKGMSGDFTLSYKITALSGLGDGGQQIFRLPASFRIPVIVGGIPFYLGLKTSFFVAIGFGQEGATVQGSYHFTYDGDNGLSKAESGDTSAEGNGSGDGSILDSLLNPLTKGPIGIILGVEMPRVDFGIGVEGAEVGGYVDFIGTTGVKIGGGIPAFGASTSGCDARELEATAKAGLYLSVFGFKVAPPSATLFDQKENLSSPPGCGAIGG